MPANGFARSVRTTLSNDESRIKETAPRSINRQAHCKLRQLRNEVRLRGNHHLSAFFGRRRSETHTQYSQFDVGAEPCNIQRFALPK